jgi:uncharacterized FlaG/YvyC family protein
MEIGSAIPIVPGQAGIGTRAVAAAERPEAQAAQREEAGSQDAASRLQAALDTAAAELNLPRFSNNQLELDVDQGTGRVLGRLVDPESGEVVVQIPDETTLRLIRRAQELLGSLTNKVV